MFGIDIMVIFVILLFAFIIISVLNTNRNKVNNTTIIAILIPYYYSLSDKYKTALLKQLDKSSRREFEYILQEANVTEKHLAASYKRYQYLTKIAKILYLSIAKYYTIQALYYYQSLSQSEQKLIYQTLPESEAKRMAGYLADVLSYSSPIDDKLINNKWLVLIPLVHIILEKESDELKEFKAITTHSSLLNKMANQLL